MTIRAFLQRRLEHLYWLHLAAAWPARPGPCLPAFPPAIADLWGGYSAFTTSLYGFLVQRRVQPFRIEFIFARCRAGRGLQYFWWELLVKRMGLLCGYIATFNVYLLYGSEALI